MSNLLQFSSESAYFSQSLPPSLKALLDKALQVKDTNKREDLLLQARENWVGQIDVHISLYKFYFVQARYDQAEAAVWASLVQAAKQIGCTRNYRRLSKKSADWQLKNGPERLYLFSLKALGVCRLRRGRVLAAKTVLAKLRELDTHDEIGGLAFYEIACSFFSDEG